MAHVDSAEAKVFHGVDTAWLDSAAAHFRAGLDRPAPSTPPARGPGPRAGGEQIGRRELQERYASSSEAWTAGQAVFAVPVTRRYRGVEPVGRVTVTVLPEAGSKR